MATVTKAKGLEGEEAKTHRIRITLTSQNVASLEKGACSGGCVPRGRGKEEEAGNWWRGAPRGKRGAPTRRRRFRARRGPCPVALARV